eukprot:sb/3471517/
MAGVLHEYRVRRVPKTKIQLGNNAPITIEELSGKVDEGINSWEESNSWKIYPDFTEITNIDGARSAWYVFLWFSGFFTVRHSFCRMIKRSGDVMLNPELKTFPPFTRPLRAEGSVTGYRFDLDTLITPPEGDEEPEECHNLHGLIIPSRKLMGMFFACTAEFVPLNPMFIEMQQDNEYERGC